MQSNTANGRATGWQAQADIALDGGVSVLRLPVTVLPGLDAPLLGMDVLGRLRFEQADCELRLRPR